MSKLANKVALVTGGSRGIGAASRSVWPRMERAWPLRTRRTSARLPPWSKTSAQLHAAAPDMLPSWAHV
jgi:NADP-dependent 3-hydroxy acid dehydrogenase YdfG